MKKEIETHKHYDHELLEDYAAGIVTSSAHNAITAHLEQCENCRYVYEGIVFLNEAHEGNREEKDRHIKEAAEASLKKILAGASLGKSLGSDSAKSSEKNEENRCESSNIISADHDSGKTLVSRDDEIPKKPAPKIRSLNYYLLRAAAILLIITLPTVSYLLMRPPADDQLVASYLSHPYGVEVRGDNPLLWPNRYSQGRYAEVITDLEKQIAAGTATAEMYFYNGISYLYLPDPAPDKAIENLEKVRATDNLYSEQALWFLSLAYFKLGDKETAANILEQISGYKNKEAKKLLEKMKY